MDIPLFSKPEVYGVELPDTVHFTSRDLIFLVFAVYYSVTCSDTMQMENGTTQGG